MKGNGTKGMDTIIVIMIIVAIAALCIGIYAFVMSTGDEGLGGIIVGVISFVLIPITKGFRTIVEAASLYIEKQKEC